MKVLLQVLLLNLLKDKEGLLCKINKVLENKLNLDVELTILNEFNIYPYITLI